MRRPDDLFKVAVYALFLLSGATALVYESVWARSLTLIFGATHEAVSIVLGAFMGGLALGGAVIGRRVGRMKRPLLVYGILELAIALSALAVPLALALVDRIYVSAALELSGQSWQLQALRAVLAAGVLLVPTFLMGGTLPVLVGLLSSRSKALGRNLSILYGINTAGAVLGIIGAGFLLLPALGMRRTTLVAVLLNVGIGVAAVIVDRLRQAGDLAEVNASPTPGVDVQSGENQAASASAPLRLTFFGTAICGFGALALEVMWMRGITIAVGNTAYSFAVMLAAFLIGIALGSWIHARFPLRALGEARQFALLLVILGVASAVVSQSFPVLPRLALSLNMVLYEDPSGVRAAATLLLSFAVMLIPAILLGIAFPLAGEAGARLEGDIGRSVGNLVAINTTGAIAGSLAAAYLLIPSLGLQRSMLLIAAVFASYGSAVLTAELVAKRRLHAWIGRLAAVAIALALILVGFRLPPWDLHLLSVFRNNMMSSFVDGGTEALRKIAAQSSVFYYREGKSSNVTVVEGPRARSLVIDGKTVATDGLSDMQHELLLGHVPVLVHPSPRHAAVIGLGAGITLGAVLSHEELESVTVVELEPAVVDAARLFAHVNDRALDDPRLEIVIQDGRNSLLTSPRRFDVITADPIHPWARGAAYLYTTEYYELARRRLTDHGVMCQWLPLYELSLENIRSAIASFSDVFPHTTVWRTAFDAILIGTTKPLALEPATLSRRLREPRVARQLRQIGLDDAASFLAELVLDEEAVREFSADAIRNTDDNLYLEFSSPKKIARSEVANINLALDAASAPFTSVLAGTRRAEMAPLAEAYRRAKLTTIDAQRSIQHADAGDSPEGYQPVIEALEHVVAEHPSYGRARNLLTEAWVGRGVQHYFRGELDQALPMLEEALEVTPRSATANYYMGTFLSESGRYSEALVFFEMSIDERASSLAHMNHGVTLLRLGRPEMAAVELERATELRPGDAEAHHMLATALAELGRGAEARANFDLALRLRPTLPGVRTNFATHLLSTGDYRRALEVLTAGSVPPDERLAASRLEAWILAAAPVPELRDPTRALRLAESIHQATEGRIPICLDTYAVALAAAGRFDEATSVASRGAELAARQGDHELAAAIAERRSLFETRRPFLERETSTNRAHQ